MSNVGMKRTDKTSANGPGLGYEYQYMCFIRQLLNIKKGETVGYEVLDDIHVVSGMQQTMYIQVKHTIDTAADGTQANLTNLSPDLWKTLSNWSQMILDSNDGRSKVREQKEFLKKAKFVLQINRKIIKTEIINIIQDAGEDKLTRITAKNRISQLKNLTTNEEIKNYIDNVLKLNSLIVDFLKKVEVISSCTDIIEELKEEIRRKMVSDQFVEPILSEVYFKLKKDFFDKVQKREIQLISYEEWLENYKPIFNQYRETLLPSESFNFELPDRLEDQFFVGELKEIGIIDTSDEDAIAELCQLTGFYLKLQCQLDSWYENGYISEKQKKEYEKDAFLLWKRSHQSAHRTTKKDKELDNDNAYECYLEILTKELQLASQTISLELSNGQFIKMANERDIGWKYKWKGQYHNEKYTD